VRCHAPQRAQGVAGRGLLTAADDRRAVARRWSSRSKPAACPAPAARPGVGLQRPQLDGIFFGANQRVWIRRPLPALKIIVIGQGVACASCKPWLAAWQRTFGPGHGGHGVQRAVASCASGTWRPSERRA
jgi:hypothetical protein